MRSFLPLLLILIVGTPGLKAQTPPPATVEGMALIPGASFDMGTAQAEVLGLMQRFQVRRAELFAEELPRHRATIGSFYIDRNEVTNAQFKAFIEKDSAWQKSRIPASLHNGKYLENWAGNEYPAGKADDPVNFVSWYAAAAYCQSQGKRLPTEAEWEYAARGGLDGKAFPWGDELPEKSRANYGASEIKAPTRVASYPANGYGLHDMAGNVWEFLADEWQSYPIKPSPNASAEASFREVTTRRALRGGSFGGGVVNLRVTYRDSHMPGNAVEHVGFRCALTSPVQSESVNELLRLHYADRAAHFNRDAAYIFAQFADDYVSIGDGRVRRGDPAAGQKRMQAYFDASTFLEWDDITPPIIRVSADGSMASSIVNKKVRLLSKDPEGKLKEEVEVFAWTMTFRRVQNKWKVTSVTSTRTPEIDK